MANAIPQLRGRSLCGRFLYGLAWMVLFLYMLDSCVPRRELSTGRAAFLAVAPFFLLYMGDNSAAIRAEMEAIRRELDAEDERREADGEDAEDEDGSEEYTDDDEDSDEGYSSLGDTDAESEAESTDGEEGYDSEWKDGPHGESGQGAPIVAAA